MSNISSDPNNSAGVDTKRSRKPPPETGSYLRYMEKKLILLE